MHKSTVILLAVTSEFVGETLSKLAIEKLVADKDKTQNLGSLNLSDHTGIRVDGKLIVKPSQAKQYEPIIFEQATGGFKILPKSEHIPAPENAGRGARGLSQEQRDAQAASELAALRAKKTAQAKPAANVPVVVTGANKPNGVAVPASK